MFSKPAPFVQYGPPKLGLNDAYCFPTTTNLTIKPHNGWHGLSLEVATDSKQPVLKCTSLKRGWSSKKEIKTASGQLVYNLVRHSMSTHEAFTLEAPNGSTIARVHWKGYGKPKFDVHFHSLFSQGELTLEARYQGLMGQDVKMSVNGKEVASAEAPGWTHPWRVQVEGGVDQSLVSLLAFRRFEWYW